MAPCEFEVFADGDWNKVVKLGPYDRPGSLSNVTPEGSEIIIFECAEDDSRTTISRSKKGAHTEQGRARTIYSWEKEEIVELKPGQFYEMDITTQDGSSAKVRFRHK
jgi:hypothetical protein